MLATSLTLVFLQNFKTPEKVLERKVEHHYAVSNPQFRREMSALLGPAIVHGNQVTALQNGNEIFPVMLLAIRSAQTSIIFETFIYWSGATGEEFWRLSRIPLPVGRAVRCAKSSPKRSCYQSNRNFESGFVQSPRRNGVLAMTATSIYDALRESHEIQRAVFRKLLRSKPGSQERIDLFAQARHELAAHEAAEERYLYVPMMMHDLGLSASRHALHEHHQVDELVEHLQGLDPAGEAWIEQAKALSHEVHHHLREEEKKFFQVSGKLLSDAQKLKPAGQYRRDYLRMHRLLAADSR